MNINNGALYFGAGIDRTQWRRDIDSMRRDILGLSQATVQQTRNMDSSFKNLSLGIAGAFSVSTIKSFVMELINVRGEFQKTEIAFTTMIGNATEAKGLMGQMVELAAKTPFSLQDVSSGAKQLLAFQIPASEVVDTLTRMGNIAAGLSVPIQRINLVYGQVKAKGKLMGDDLRQFTEAGIPMVAELAKKFGKTTAEISAMVSAGKIGFKDVKDVLFSMTNQGGMFFNLMEKQSQSLSGQIANLGDEWDQMLNKIGEANEGLLSDGIKGLTYLVEHYKDVIQIISMLVAAYGTYKAVLIATTYLQKLSISMETVKVWISLAMSIRTAADAQALFNLTVQANPYVLLATGIAAVVAALVYLRTYSADAKDEAEKLTSAMEFQKAVSDSIASAYKRNSETVVGSIEKEITVLKSSYSTTEMRKKAYENLIKLNKSFTGTVDGEYKATQRLSDAYRNLVDRLKELSIAKGKAALLEELSKKKAQADLDLVFKEEDYERQRIENIRKRADNAKKLGSLPKSSMYYEVMLEKDIDYSAYNPVKDARKTKDEINKQFTRLADDVTKGIADASKKNDKELKNAWSNVGEEVLSDGPKRGTKKWYEDEIKRMEEANDHLQVSSKEYLANLAKIKEYRKKISPEGDKKEGRQLAEIIPLGSIKELQRRANLLKEAMDTAVDGIVKLRKVDKYGNDKDKQGNPYFTGETITMDSAVKLYEEYDAKIKALQLRNFQERIDESERQWNNYYKTAEYYGKESADAQYRDLFNGAKNYLDYLEKQEQALVKLSEKSVLTSQQKQDLVFIREKINGLKGLDTPFENTRKGIENAMKAIPSLTEQLDLIDKLRSVNKIVNVNNPGKFYEKDKYYKELSDGVLQQQHDQYIQFEKEHLSFEQRKTEITQRYDNIRLRIQQSNDSEQEKSRKTQEANKDQAKEISTMSWEQFQKTDAYVKAFGDLEKVGPRTLKKLRDQFKEFIESEPGKALNIQDLKALNEVYSKLDEATKNRNPFEAIGIAVEKYKKKREELNKIEKESGKDSEAYQQKLDYTRSSFEEIVDTSYDASKKMIGYFSGITEAVGGMSDELRATISDVEQLVEGVYNAFKGFYGNKGQMVTGIIQIVGALSKIMNGDNQKEAVIKGWQKDIENLKYLYEQLNKEIEKTAGEASIKKYSELIANLKKQQQLLVDMRTKESEKKNPDVDKVDNYSNQIRDISAQVEELVYTFKQTVTTIEFKDLSKKLADALTEAFGQGEDAAKAFDRVVDDVMRNAVQNALKVKILEPAVQNMVDQLYSSMGFGNSSTSAVQAEISAVESKLKEIEEKLKTAGFQEGLILKDIQKEQLEKLKLLQQQLTEIYSNGSFDGLTQEERDKIKAMGEDAMKKYMEALKQYQDLFGQSAENAQGLKGDIKGITEKTAGALEGQFNAVRINISEVLKIMKGNQTVANAQTVLLSKIESNTSNLIQIRKDMAELNNKIKPGLAGIP
ncbi:tape measure protein [Chryseobacterium sp. WLY505]|uniref:tape measure protein n=1 Tax=Chryseobacterium sp. WLY505 TaxID=3068892 RepID=UPI002796B0FD|nr:tape measure protein [Chryseobacterium sp. WLY505]MDQ1859030.1 tape measure protein [Chryseobacterium sp. WLY505]